MMPKLNRTEFAKLLHDLGACGEAVKWAEGRTLAWAYRYCSRSDWLLWLAEKMAGHPNWPTQPEVALAGCDCAETALPIWYKFAPDDHRPRIAIEMRRKFEAGLATQNDLATAGAAAWDAAWAAHHAKMCKIIRNRFKPPRW